MTKISDQVNIAVISSNIEYIKNDVKDIKTKLEADYVTKESFEPIRKLVYGTVAFILVAVAGAAITLILRTNNGQTLTSVIQQK